MNRMKTARPITQPKAHMRKEFVPGWHWEGNTLRNDQDTLEIYLGDDDMFHVRDYMSEQFLKESFDTLTDATIAATSRSSVWFYPEEFYNDILAPTQSFKRGDLGELILLDLLYQNKHLFNSPEELAIQTLTENAVQIMDRIAPGKTPINKAKAYRMAAQIYRHYKALRPGARRLKMIQRIKAMPEQMLTGLCQSVMDAASGSPDSQGNPSFFYSCMDKDLGSFGASMDEDRKKSYCGWLKRECKARGYVPSD